MAGVRRTSMGKSSRRPASISNIRTYFEKSENAVKFDVVPTDEEDTLYQIRLDGCAGWKGTVRQLRIDFSADETPLTGTVRIDYIWLGSTPK